MIEGNNVVSKERKQAGTIQTIVNFSFKIPENSIESWPAELAKWLRENVPEVIENVLNDRFEDELIEWYNEDFEPEIEGFTDMGEMIKLEVIRVVGENNPIHCVYCGGVCKREIWAGPPSGIKGDYGAMDCQTCGMNIIFRTQDHASIAKKTELSKEESK